VKDKQKEINSKLQILLVVGNNSIPQDTRVWAEAKALKENSSEVSKLSPNNKVLDGIEIYPYLSFTERATVFGLLFECILSPIFIYSRKVYLGEFFNIVHMANPLDLLCIILFSPILFMVKGFFDYKNDGIYGLR